jgi:EAL domain-containing protein (putative c-di-GMP-specific phosphodiesterase class I)
VDRSFVKDLATNSDDRAIIRAMTLMAHSMKLKVVAEGVETPGQLTFLRSLQCDEMQGYLYSGPVPAEELQLMVGAAMNTQSRLAS